MKLRRRWKALITVAAFALFLVGGCIVASRDEPPPDDSALAVERVMVAEEENGFRFLADAPEAQPVLAEDESGEELDPGDPFTAEWKPDLARRFVDKNRELLEQLDKSLAAPRFQVPAIGASCRRSSTTSCPGTCRPCRWTPSTPGRSSTRASKRSSTRSAPRTATPTGATRT